MHNPNGLIMTIEQIRADFKYLDENSIYFNHASTGPLSGKIINRINSFLSGRSTGDISNYQTYLDNSASLKEKFGKLLNCNAGEISFSPNVATAMSLLANGLPWQKGDRIILNDLEFPSNVYPFLNLQSKGVEIDFVKNTNGKILFDDIEKLVTENTKLISISLVQFLTGWLSDAELIGKLCREKGIIFAVDGIQAAGNTIIDLQKINADFLAGGTQKWLMGLQGLSYFYISQDLMNKISPSTIGWNSVNNQWALLDYNLDLKENADRFEPGTPNAVGIAAADEALNVFLDFGMENIQNLIKSNTRYLMDRLYENNFHPLLLNADERNFAGITTLQIENSKEIFKNLLSQKIYCSLREGYLRLSPHFYNTKSEIDAVVSVLSKFNN